MKYDRGNWNVHEFTSWKDTQLKKKKKAGIVLTMNFRHIFKNINIIFLLVDSCGGPEKGRGWCGQETD